MKVGVKNDEYNIYQRRDGRYAVENAAKKAVNGDEKVAILLANELVKVTLPTAPAEEPAAAAAVAAAPAAGGARRGPRRRGACAEGT